MQNKDSGFVGGKVKSPQNHISGKGLKLSPERGRFPGPTKERIKKRNKEREV